jgi:two-component system, chemotaxis family, CheB/CheR fusion protein
MRQLFDALPADTGMGFVVIQHMDPDRPSMLVNILSTVTRMPVIEATDGMPVQANRVHVIPPAEDLLVRGGTLALVPRPQDGKVPHLPINLFFTSLAEDRQGAAVAVVLSGSGSDGTGGLRAVKAAEGITFAQDPASAQFRSMPESAIAAGVVDGVLPCADLARELARGGASRISPVPVGRASAGGQCSRATRPLRG